MKDDIIIHSVMVLAFMALIAQGHADKETDDNKEASDGWNHGGYRPYRGHGGYVSHNYGGYGPGYGGYKSHYGGYRGHKSHYGGYKSGYGGHKSHFGGYGGYKSNYGYGGFGPHYGGGYGGYGYNLGYGYGSPYGGYGSPFIMAGYGHEHEDEEKDQAHKNTEGYSIPEFDYGYVDHYINKIHDYSDSQNDYKTDHLNVKVKWDLQDGKYEYLKNQYGIYPQLQPYYGHAGYGYGGYFGGRYGKPHYGGGYQKQNYGGYGGGYGYGGHKKSHYGGYGGGYGSNHPDQATDSGNQGPIQDEPQE